MSKKGKIILGIIFGILGLGCVIFYLVNPELAKECLQYTLDILDRPLPIAGITVGAVLLFIWRLVATTNYGKKKLALYDLKLEEIENAKKELEEEKDKVINELKNENEVLRQQVVSLCSLSTNKKIKDYGKELEHYGEKTVECETKAD